MQERPAYIYTMVDYDLEKRYIQGIHQALNIKQNIIKEVSNMTFDVEKLNAYYADLLAKREEAIAIALADKEARVAEKVAEAKANIEAEIEAEIIVEASAPFAKDIELCENFIADPVETDEIEEIAEETDAETTVDAEYTE